MTGIEAIAAERERQIKKEKWSAKHDDDHTDGSLARAAACYAIIGSMDADDRRRNKDPSPTDGFFNIIYTTWPRDWAWCWWKPKNRRRDLVRAGALIAAEIDRLDRAAKV